MPAFNPLVEKLAPPPVPSVFAWGRAYDGSRGPLIDLSQAVPGYPPHPDMLTLLGEMAGSTAYCGYGPIEGETVLRQAYAEHVSEVYGAEIGSGNIHVTSGCNEAFVSAAMAVAGPGQTVLMTNPFYFNHETTLAMMGVKIRTVACAAEDGFVPQVEAGWEDRLIGLYSFSKSFCIPGHRLGAITAGAKAVEQIAKIMDNLQICAPRAAQAAVARALPMLADWREGNRQEIGRRAEALKAALAQVPDWRIDAIGAYFAFVRHPFPSLDSAAVAERLAKQAGVVCIPGMYFGEGQEHYLRFAFANADVPTIALLEERLKNFAAG